MLDVRSRAPGLARAGPTLSVTSLLAPEPLRAFSGRNRTVLFPSQRSPWDSPLFTVSTPLRGCLSSHRTAASRAAAWGGVRHVPQRPTLRSLPAAVTELAPQGLCVHAGRRRSRSWGPGARIGRQTASAHLHVGQHWGE